MGDFTNNTVNIQFRKAYQELERLRLIRGKSDIAKKLGTYNHVINSILKGQRNITVDQLNKLFDTYHLNANFFFGLSEELFLNGYYPVDQLPSLGMEARQMGPRENITLVPERAMAGYAEQAQDAAYLDSLQKFSIPGYSGNLVAFEISGDSMTPTITNGDYVVCESIERDSPLRDNNVYVIVTDVVVAKRIQQIREGNVLKRLNLISDNSTVYQPYTVELEEVRQILKVKCRLTSYAIG